MQVKYQKHMRALWRLAGEIGTIAENETDRRYAAVYEKLSDALDQAEGMGLITHVDETETNRKRKAKK